MRISAVAVLMIITTVILSACAQDNVADLDDRGHQSYGRSNINTAPSFQSVPVDRVVSNDLTPASAPRPQPRTVVAAPVAKPAPAPAPVQQLAMSASGWQWPVQGKVIEKFGRKANGVSSEGITIAAPAGTPVRAASAGQVAYVGHALKDYGNMVILRHPNGTFSAYAHASKITVAKGDQVKRGQMLGYVGSSGNAKVPELHFAIRQGTHSIDPLSKLPSQVAAN